jgi:hypothetical protein
MSRELFKMEAGNDGVLSNNPIDPIASGLFTAEEDTAGIENEFVLTLFVKVQPEKEICAF